MFKKILIANRGVIAFRILKTLKENSIKTVAVYTPGDESSLHVTESDENICIRSYNEIPEIISVARQFKVDAVHPGVGFLSENIDFAKVANHYTVFIGPDTPLFIKMGNKVKARMIAEEAGIPRTPGSNGTLKTEKEAVNIAHTIGYPVIIKAVDKYSAELKKEIAFREFLRQNKEYALRLSELKWSLAEEFSNDREAYIEGKAALCREITEKALNAKDG